MKQSLVILMVALAAMLCARAAEAPKPGGFLPLTPDGYPAGTSNAPAVAPAPSAVATTDASATEVTTVGGMVLDDRHKLTAGDKLSFQILEDRFLPTVGDNRPAAPSTADLAKPLIVGDTGELDVPYVGRVKVSGKTCKEVAGELKVLLEKDYYVKATVVLGLDQMSRVLGRVYVWGEVRNPGPVEIPANENFTAGRAILRAGGFSDWAKKSKVKVVRATKPGGTPSEPIIVDMEQVLDQGKTDKDIPMDAEDFIIVPKRIINL